MARRRVEEGVEYEYFNFTILRKRGSEGFCDITKLRPGQMDAFLPGLTSHLFGLILLLLLLFAHLVESRENTHRWPVKSLAPRGAPKRKKWTPKFGESPNRTRFFSDPPGGIN